MSMTDAEGIEHDRLVRCLVSVKGVVRQDDGIILLKNQRGEWELPGGKLEVGESITACLAREFQEELALSVEPGPVLDVGLHHYFPDIVVIVFGCHAKPVASLHHTDEHRAAGCFTPDQIDSLTMAPLYRRAITMWMEDARSIRPSAGDTQTQ
jgi:8-oxo-dGTP pyrophosphatase MutT (NUDIX family)